MGEKRTTKTMTTSQLRDFANQLRKQADALDAVLAEAERIEANTFDVGLYPTLAKGIDSLSKFIGAAHAAISSRVLRQSIGELDRIGKSQQAASQLAAEDKPPYKTDSKKKPKP